MLIVVPARLDSTRLPGKLLLPVNGKPLIWYTIKTVQKCIEAFQKKRKREANFVITTDSADIEQYCQSFCQVVKTGPCECGTQRVEEACGIIRKTTAGSLLNSNICVYQADVPYLNQQDFLKLPTRNRTGSLFYRTDKKTDADNPNKVKIIIQDGYAKYFSRAPIPYNSKEWLIHVGIYSFLGWGYLNYEVNMAIKDKMNAHLSCENLEQLHWRENIYLGEVPPVINVDTKADLDEFEDFVKNNKGLW